jgi:hypothetical protein
MTWFRGDRDSPLLVTRIAGLSGSGQTCSHPPHPVHRSGTTRGRGTSTTLPSGCGTSRFSNQIALGDTGQNSSHTMQGLPCAHGRQMDTSKAAVPILTLLAVLSSSVKGRIAPVGQTCEQSVQDGSQ